MDWRRIRRLRALLCRESQVVAHTHLTSANIVGALAAARSGTAVVASLHNTEPIGGKRARTKQWLEHRVLERMTAGIVAVGESVASAHRSHLRGVEIDVLPNAVSIPAPMSDDRRQRIRQRLTGSDRPIVLAIGRLTDQKAHHILIEAFRSVSERTEPILLIAGEGPLRPRLEDLIRSTGQEERIRLLGERGDIVDLLAASDLVVSASLWEGLPVAILEAMAAARPIVTTDVGEIPKVLGEQAGVLVPAGAIGQLASAVSALLDNRSHREELGAQALQVVLERHSAAAWANRLRQIYVRAAASTPANR